MASNDSGHDKDFNEIANPLIWKDGTATDHLEGIFFSLDNKRMQALLEAYGEVYGGSAQAYAARTYYLWRSGVVGMSSLTMGRLFDLLPRFMTQAEKLELIRRLRRQALLGVRSTSIKIMISDPTDMMPVISQAMGLVQRIGEIELPANFMNVQGWINEADSQAMALLIKESEMHIATERLVDLMAQLANISRLRQLSALNLTLRVTTQFEIPTASFYITFADTFWKGKTMADAPDNETDLLVRLQEIALREEHQVGGISYVDYVMRTLSPAEQAQLRSIAAVEGLKTEILLKELQVKTLAARGDIQSLMETAAELKAKGHNSKISSEHHTASGVTKIEIENRRTGCASMFSGILILLCVVLVFAMWTIH